jgi:hypothetical protein
VKLKKTLKTLSSAKKPKKNQKYTKNTKKHKKTHKKPAGLGFFFKKTGFFPTLLRCAQRNDIVDKKIHIHHTEPNPDPPK